jgi:hypothetical protein
MVYDPRGLEAIFADGKKSVNTRPEDIEETICEVDGYWPLYISFDGV